MILISHRGNLNGPNEHLENSPSYILEALNYGFDVEVDVWYKNNKFFLGHDFPIYEIGVDFLTNDRLWCHAKNVEAIIEMKKYVIHYFWYEKDTITLTSKNYIWSYPNKCAIKNSIVVLPEVYNTNIENVRGICSDYITNYKIGF